MMLHMPGKAEEDGGAPKRLYKRYELSDEKSFASLFFPGKRELLFMLDHFVNKSGKFAVPGFPHKLGLLLYGPPGTGKTHVVRAAAATFGLPLLVLQGSGGGGGADELCARLRTTFARAEAEAEAATIARGQATPALLFMDELDTLCPKRSDAGSSDDDRRAVAQLLTLLDGVTPRQRVIAVAATNRAHGIDGAPRSDPGPRAPRPCPS